MLEGICPPALLYLAFSLTQIVIDIFKRLNNTAFFKFIVMIIFTLMLNILCSKGLGIVSWFLVFIPFISMSIITSILLFAFGLHPSSGSLNYNVSYPGQKSKQNVEKVIIIDPRDKQGQTQSTDKKNPQGTEQPNVNKKTTPISGAKIN